MYTPVKNPQHQKGTLLGEYLAFVRRPSITPEKITVRETVSRVWRLYSLHLILMIPMMGMIRVLSQWMVSVEDNKITELMNTIPLYQVVLMAVVMAPLLEELVFRLPLKFSGLNLAILCGLFSFSVGGQLLPMNERPLFSMVCLLGILFLSIQIPLWLCKKITKPKGEAFFAKHLIWLVYVSSVLFGAVHITNYPMTAWLAAPILVLPQTTLGVLLAYVRLKFGYWWAVITHGLHNLLVTSPLIFIAFGSDQLKAKVLEQSEEVSLLPQDRWIEGLLGVWAIAVVIFITVTTVKLILEWKNDRRPAKA